MALASCDPRALDTEPTRDSQSNLLKDQTYGSVNNGPNSDWDLPANEVILTFDDGPDGAPWSATPNITLSIAKFLHDEGIHAVFFINGKRFKGQQLAGNCQLGGYNLCGAPQDGHANLNYRTYDESVLDTIVGYGHRIANHTQDHCNIGWDANQPAVVNELRETQAVLDRHAGDGPFLFRPPYGNWAGNDGPNVRGDRCLDKLEGPVNWDMDGGDWGCWTNACTQTDNQGNCIACASPVRPSLTVDQCLNSYIGQLNGRARKNGIFLHHDRPEYVHDLADYYAGTNGYASQLIPLLNDGIYYENNEFGFIKAWVKYLKTHGYTFGRIEEIFSSKRVRNWSKCGDYSDGDSGFGANAGYYRSFRLADVNGDGVADACARTSGGIECATNIGNGQFNAHSIWLGSNFTDALGWLPVQYGTTLQFADLNGDGYADVCGRGGSGLLCAASNGTGFNAPTWASTWPDFSDNAGWAGGESYYGSIHLADVNGDGYPDACARASNGIVCALNTAGLSQDHAIHFTQATVWLSQDFTDGYGWYPAQYGATVQFADINGDGRADVCGRGGAGIRCALAQIGGGFAPPTWWSQWPDFSDNDNNAGGWQTSPYWKSIHLADVDGNGQADICGRTSSGIVCALSTGTSFLHYQFQPYLAETPPGDDYTDGLGWASDQYGATIQFGRLDWDSKADLCGRGGRGLFCGLTP